MKKWKNILMCVALGGALVSCVDLDIPPKNIMTNEDIYNEGGITAYMAGLYNHLPMEDFNMGDDGGRGGFFNWLSDKTTMGSTGEYANNVVVIAVSTVTRVTGNLLIKLYVRQMC